MSNAIKLNDYLKRQKELFKAYIDSSGKEISVSPFVSVYSSEDGVTYTNEDLLKMIDAYINSNLITKEEKEAFEKTKKVPNDVIFKRGRIIIEAIIESQGNTKDLDRLGREFAKKDGRIHPYDRTYLLKCRDYYLKTSENTDILLAYKNVCELVSRGSYDIELPLKILEFKDNKKAIEFINRINISKSSLRKLVDEYETLYPANTANITRLNHLLKEAYKIENTVVNFYEYKISHDRVKDRLVNLRRILEEYLTTDIEDISDIYSKYQFNDYKFNETLKDAETGRDLLLNNLIIKYKAKSLSIKNSYKEIIEKIMQACVNGINYGYGYREFNMYDYYTIKGDISSEDLIKYAQMIYEDEDANNIIEVINQFERKTLVSKGELKISHNDSDTELILDYLEYAKLPICEEMYEAVRNRFKENDISFEIIDSKKVVGLWIK